ncbi:hypothetical protein VP01_777g2 [Puccinia sorghi]|uniref:Uncharacterized protein n=1 Tax=Puccinia sorghi TaxID=27349 RepID=A0A0L6UBB8_9BASI|nr:hypothetical protein VP01_777g2 [Puccinia sorghi]
MKSCSIKIEEVPKSIKIKGEENKIIISWKTDNTKLANFKSKVMLAILVESKSLVWKVAIKNSGTWAGSVDQNLEPINQLFKEFLNAASLDLQLAAKIQMAFYQIQMSLSGGNGIQTIPHKNKPTPGAPSSAMLHELIQEILSSHNLCERLFHLHTQANCQPEQHL